MCMEIALFKVTNFRPPQQWLSDTYEGLDSSSFVRHSHSSPSPIRISRVSRVGKHFSCNEQAPCCSRHWRNQDLHSGKAPVVLGFANGESYNNASCIRKLFVE